MNRVSVHHVGNGWYEWTVTSAEGEVLAEGTEYNYDDADRAAMKWLRKNDPAEIAKAEAKRQKRNAAARARNDAMRSVGMTKTRYGWE